jgi:hypothetical protein
MAGPITAGLIRPCRARSSGGVFRADAQSRGSGGCAAHDIGAHSFRVGDFVKDLAQEFFGAALGT